jgi:hypothetical protein
MLRNRQLNNINAFISGPQPKSEQGKRLIDSMNFNDQAQPMLPAKQMTPGKRRRHETDKPDHAQQGKKYRRSPVHDMPATVIEPCEEKREELLSSESKDANGVIASRTVAHNRTQAENAPGDSKNTAIFSDSDRRSRVDSHKVVIADDDSVSRAESMNENATTESKATKLELGCEKIQRSAKYQAKGSVTNTLGAYAEVSQGSASIKPRITVEGCRNTAINSSSSVPSPPLSKDSSPTKKQPIPDVEAEPVEHANKKQCLSDARPPILELLYNEHRLANTKVQKTCRASLHTVAPVVANTECEHTYAEYDDDSIPILYSASIQRHDSPILLNNPSVELRVQAHILLENRRGFTAEDMGRPNVPKSGRTRVIDNVDLYLKTDSKIYVATERGLLLTAQ